MSKLTKHSVHYSKEEYAEYLRSDEWSTLRDSVLRLSQTCAFCKKNKATQVHHLTYRNIVDVQRSDLAPTCDPCHEKIHVLARKGYLNFDSHKSGSKLLKRTLRLLQNVASGARIKRTIDSHLAARIAASDTPRRIGGLLRVTIGSASDIEGLRVSEVTLGKIMRLLERPIFTRRPAYSKDVRTIKI